jgi:hypothetical protein
MCQGHEDSQEQRLKELFKSNFQNKEQNKIMQFKIWTHEPKTISRDVQDKHENGYLLC